MSNDVIKKGAFFVLVFFLVSIAFYNYNKELEYSSGNIYEKGLSAILGLLSAIGNIFSSVFNFLGYYIDWSSLISLLVVLLVIFGIVYYITK